MTDRQTDGIMTPKTDVAYARTVKIGAVLPRAVVVYNPTRFHENHLKTFRASLLTNRRMDSGENIIIFLSEITRHNEQLLNPLKGRDVNWLHLAIQV